MVVNNSKVEVVRKSPTPEVQEQPAPVKEESLKEVTKSLENIEIAPKKVVEEEKKDKSPTPAKEEEKKEEAKVEEKKVSPPKEVVEVKKVDEMAKPKQNGIPSLLDNIPMELRRDNFANQKEEVMEANKEEREEGEISEDDDE